LALAAAAAGLPFDLYERGPGPAANVRAWGHVRLFTPWSMSVSPRMRSVLAETGRDVPSSAEECPTGAELVRQVYEPIAALPTMVACLHYGVRVLEVGRHGLTKEQEIATAERASRPFRILVEEAGNGEERIETADVVLDATGTYGQPNSLGDGGIPAPGERAAAARIVRQIPDVLGQAGTWAGQRVLLVGGGHSAQTAARDFDTVMRQGASIDLIWALRGATPELVADDPLPERAALTRSAAALAAGSNPAIRVIAPAVVEYLRPAENGLVVTLRAGDELIQVEVDRVVSLTGSVGDHRIYRQLQVHECYATAGPMKLSAKLLGDGASDCLVQTGGGLEVLKNPEPGFFFLGSKSYGRNAIFLLRSGWEQADEVIGSLSSRA
jgi:hypothetical protein